MKILTNSHSYLNTEKRIDDKHKSSTVLSNPNKHLADLSTSLAYKNQILYNPSFCGPKEDKNITSSQSPENIEENKELIKEIDTSTLKRLLNYMNQNRTDNTFPFKLAAQKIQNNDGEMVNLLSCDECINVLDVNQRDDEIIQNLFGNSKLKILLKSINLDNFTQFKNKTLIDILMSKLPKKLDLNSQFKFSEPYLDDKYQFEIKNKNSSNIIFLSKKGDEFIYEGSEETKRNGNKTSVKQKRTDGTMLVQEIEYEEKNDTPISIKKTLYDSNGVQIQSEIMTPSKEKKGIINTSLYERGLNKPIQKSNPNNIEFYGSQKQGFKIERKTRSASGYETTQKIIEGPKGKSMYYEIKAPDGKILTKINRKFRKIDEDHYISSLNGQKYDIQYCDKGIAISSISAGGSLTPWIKFGYNKLDPQLIDLYKQLPGDFFVKLCRIGTKEVIYDPNYNNASYNSQEERITIGPEYKNSPFTFAHELGHGLDNYHCHISRNSDLKRIFNAELAEYKNISSNAEGQSIDYFTKRDWEGKLGEIVAESHALFSGLTNNNENIMLRSVILQQHFPQTIAKIAQLLYETEY